MILSVQSTREHMMHNSFVYAMLYYTKRIIKEKGHAHIVIETEHSPEYINSEIGAGYGPLIFLVLDEDSTELTV